MASVQGPVFSPVVRAKQSGLSVPVNSPLLKTKLIASEFLGFKGFSYGRNNVGYRQHLRKFKTTRCSYSSSSDGNGSMAGNSNWNDADYVNSSVMEAAEVRRGPEGYMIKMRDGRNLRCVHYNPQAGPVPDYAPHPVIVLKMEDGTGILLPIIVLEIPNMLLLAALRNVHVPRPSVYNVVKDMVEQLGYVVKLVRVTKRVHEAYFAELHLVKSDNEAERLSFDMRPSDAINIAVRCKAPIQVNKILVYRDGLRAIEPSNVSLHGSSSDSRAFTELDRPTGQPCIETKEFNLVRNMLIAVVEERYWDAASWRDKLTQLRSKKNWT